MLTLVSMTLSYPYGTAQTVSEPVAVPYFRPTSTSFTVTLQGGSRFAAEPLSWIATLGGKFKQIKDLNSTDKLLTLLPNVTYLYSVFGSGSSDPLTIAQRRSYGKVSSAVLSSSNSGLLVNTTYSIQTLAPGNRCYCLISGDDCSDGGNLIATPLVTIV